MEEVNQVSGALATIVPFRLLFPSWEAKPNSSKFSHEYAVFKQVAKVTLNRYGTNTSIDIKSTLPNDAIIRMIDPKSRMITINASNIS